MCYLKPNGVSYDVRSIDLERRAWGDIVAEIIEVINRPIVSWYG